MSGRKNTGNPGEINEQLEETNAAAKAASVAAGVAAAVAFGGWCISKLLSGSDDNRKLMKAPGRNEYMYRDEFEKDTTSYFRNLRDEKKKSQQ